MQKVVSRQAGKDTSEDTDMWAKVSLQRPHTAPTGTNASSLDTIAVLPTKPITTERITPPLPPIRPARPDSSVIRDVHAWLEASMNTPSPALMSGISYWKEATGPGVKDSAAAQHVVPLFVARSAASSAGQPRRCCRRWKMRVQMPTLFRTKSQHRLDKDHANKQSASAPVLTLSYRSMGRGEVPVMMKRSTSAPNGAIRPSKWTMAAQDGGLLAVHQQSRECGTPRYGTPVSTRVGDSDSGSERRIYTMLMGTGRSADGTRPSTAGAGVGREDSMGDLSDVPTYFSGPPPPSYRSRPESMLTTSSFGCIDGMNPAQRQISPQRAALQRGMRCKLKRFAKNFVM